VRTQRLDRDGFILHANHTTTSAAFASAEKGQDRYGL
jgi:hypothetical protein